MKRVRIVQTAVLILLIACSAVQTVLVARSPSPVIIGSAIFTYGITLFILLHWLHRHALRRNRVIEQPTIAWIDLADGERVHCLLEQMGPLEWQATPVRDLDESELQGASTYLDLLPAGGSITFGFHGRSSSGFPEKGEA